MLRHAAPPANRKVMQLSNFHYDLPEELIAQAPPPERDAARMLVLHRAERRWEDRAFRDLPTFLRPGDCLVLNDSRVLPSRLLGHRAGTHSLPVGKRNPKREENLSGTVEVMLLEPAAQDAGTNAAREWRALVRPGRKMRTGEVIHFDDRLSAEIVARGERGERIVRFHGTDDVYAALDRLGHMPLPPYIKRPDAAADRDRYQTVFARERGSVAAPTAGLHFTGEILDRCERAGADIARVTLHVGLGTFQPIDREDFEQHHLHHERYAISAATWRQIEAAQRVIAVGTTSVRTIESAASTGRLAGSTDLFIYPGYPFRRVNAMLTNFHLPRTSLLLLVCAFAGTEFTLAAYRHAVESRYRFFSYGDCMLIL
jgi:S-adenosylmethionine:tRNA ribosyltransferase-isomerase